MAHNGAKTTQTLAVSFPRNSFAASGCEDFAWQKVAYNGSNPVEALSGYGSKAVSKS